MLCAACNNKLTNLGQIPDGILFKCSFCGTKKLVIDNFDLKQDVLAYGSAYREKLSNTKISGLVSLFENNYLTPTNKVELFDIGFGSGEFLLAVNKMGLKVSGLECDLNSVKLLRKKHIVAYHGELGGEMKLNKKYDLITLWDVLEHVSDIEKALSQLSSITNKYGKLFILTPNAGSSFDSMATIERRLTFYKSQRIMNICLNRYHLHRFTIKGLEILLSRFGFTVDKVERIQLFSLNSDTYTDGFAPGIMKWTKSSFINRIISNKAMTLIRVLNIKNKIFFIATKK